MSSRNGRLAYTAQTQMINKGLPHQNCGVTMQSILSIQSHVVYGYVGNRVATFILQRLGHEVMTINTVQFSNHTGYQSFEGTIFSPLHIASLLKGLHKRKVMKSLNAILTGYIGSEQLGQLILEEVNNCRKNKNNFLYCCDPVMGDIKQGLFVPESVAEFFRDTIIQHADVLTPNLFELAYLVKQPVESLNTQTKVLNAINQLQAKGPKIILVTSVQLDSTPNDCIDIIFAQENRYYRVRTQKLETLFELSGTGDAISALLLGKYLLRNNWKQAFEAAVASIYAVIKETVATGQRELQLITAQEALVAPKQFFVAQEL